MDSFKLLDRIRLNNLNDKELNEYCNIIRNDLKKVEIVEKLETGHTLIHHGSFIAISNKGYQKYRSMIGEKRFYEPHTMVMLKVENEKMKTEIKRWSELLKADGCNSKCVVANDIQKLLEELNDDM